MTERYDAGSLVAMSSEKIQAEIDRDLAKWADIGDIERVNQFASMSEEEQADHRDQMKRRRLLQDLISDLKPRVETVFRDGRSVFVCPLGGSDVHIDPFQNEDQVSCECGDGRHTGADVEEALRLQASMLPRRCTKSKSEFNHHQNCLTCMMWSAAARRVSQVIADRFSSAGLGTETETGPSPSMRGSICAFGHIHTDLRCASCQKMMTEARRISHRVETDEKWGRVDLSALPPTMPPSVGRVSKGVYLFTRGRRHVLYGEAETGKTQTGVIVACQEISKGKAAIILNGEMAEEDLRDWVMMCDPDPADVAQGLFVYRSAGLLDLEKRKQILSDLAASGRELTFVFGDSQTSLLSEAGLKPNDAEDIETLWRELVGWFIGLPPRPAFAMSDHLSKDADGSSPTGAIRKKNVVDMALLVENVTPFSPTTQYGPAKSGYSTIKFTKGRRGGRGRIVARIIGHEEKVRLASPDSPLPWVKNGPAPGASLPQETLTILHAVADGPEGGTDELVQRLPWSQNQSYALIKGLMVNEDEVGPNTLLFRRRDGNRRIPTLTDRGRSILETSTSTST